MSDIIAQCSTYHSNVPITWHGSSTTTYMNMAFQWLQFDANYTVDRVDLYLSNLNSKVWDYYFAIHKADELIYESTFSSSVAPVSPTYNWVTFNISPGIAVEPGVDYYIKLTYLTKDTTSPYSTLLWGFNDGDAEGGYYPGYGRDGGYYTDGPVANEDMNFRVYGTGASAVSTPTLESPTDETANMYLNSDWLLQLEWDDDDAEDISLYTVWFYDPAIGWIEQTDRSRYSIVGYFMWLGRYLDYDTTYYWFVRKTIDDVDYDSATWTFNTIDFDPPVVSTDGDVAPGEDAMATGENAMATIKRLVCAANNKIFYET